MLWISSNKNISLHNQQAIIKKQIESKNFNNQVVLKNLMQLLDLERGEFLVSWIFMDTILNLYTLLMIATILSSYYPDSETWLSNISWSDSSRTLWYTNLDTLRARGFARADIFPSINSHSRTTLRYRRGFTVTKKASTKTLQLFSFLVINSTCSWSSKTSVVKSKYGDF